MEAKYAELMELEEIREHAVLMIEKDQALVKIWFDKKARARTFQEGDLVLKWDADQAKLGRHSKFDAIWSGPYMVTGCKSSNAFQLSTLDGEELPFPVEFLQFNMLSKKELWYQARDQRSSWFQ
ncbi:hypothetical protein KI387_016927, partial [Taxus chinensis]